MFRTFGTYESMYEYNGEPVKGEIAFYSAQKGGFIGVGDVDSDNWRLVLYVDALGRGDYIELDASTYEQVGEGTVEFGVASRDVLEGEWCSVDESSHKITGPWTLVHKIGSNAIK